MQRNKPSQLQTLINEGRQYGDQTIGRDRIPGKAWFILLRLYGAKKPYLDNTWKPEDIVVVRPFEVTPIKVEKR